MAALQTTQVTLPTDVCLTVVGKAHDTSTIATLSPADKLGFLDDKYNVFNGKARVEVVAEGAKKGGYEQPIVPKEGKRFTVQCTTRVSKQLQWADEDDQLQILDAIQSDQAAALGEALTTWSTTPSTPRPAKRSPDTPHCPEKPRRCPPGPTRSPTSTCWPTSC